MAHFPKKLARLLQKVAHLWRILGSNLALFQNFHLETLVSTMGIRGLSTYVSARDRGDLFTEHKLRECQVVIGERSDVNSQIYFQLILAFFIIPDGSNLRYVLFGSCPKLNAAFGGDYQKYAEQIRRFFDRCE